MKRYVVIAAVAVVVAGGGVAWRLRGSGAGVLVAEDPSVPTTRVQRGTLELSVHTRGDLRASRATMIQAPSVGGGLLRLVTMVDSGTAVRAGDVILEFDPADQEFALEQANSQLAEADQQIAKLEADQAAQMAQDRVDLLAARFDMRRAELDARLDRDLLAASEYQRRQLSLEETGMRLARLEESVKSRGETSRAALAVAREARTKARLAADRARQNIESLVIRSPMDGFVVARDNRDVTNVFYSGMTLPEYRAGDAVFPGRPVADVFDISVMEIRGKVNEQQRVNVSAGQEAAVRSVVMPGVALSARVKGVSGLAQSATGPLRDFDVTLQMDRPDPRLRPGTSVELVLIGGRTGDVLHVPAQAVFDKNGKSVVYVRHGDRFEAQPVKPTQRNETRIAIEGVPEGAEVALVNPENAASAAVKSGVSPTGVTK